MWRKRPEESWAYSVRYTTGTRDVAVYYPERGRVYLKRSTISESDMDRICKWWLNRKKDS